MQMCLHICFPVPGFLGDPAEIRPEMSRNICVLHHVLQPLNMMFPTHWSAALQVHCSAHNRWCCFLSKTASMYSLCRSDVFYCLLLCFPVLCHPSTEHRQFGDARDRVTVHLLGVMECNAMQALTHVVRALERLHSCGYCHRDVNPGSILRRPNQHDWTLTDLGRTEKTGATCIGS